MSVVPVTCPQCGKPTELRWQCCAEQPLRLRKTYLSRADGHGDQVELAPEDVNRLLNERDALRSLVLRVLLGTIDDRWVVEAMGLLGLTVETLAERAGGR